MMYHLKAMAFFDIGIFLHTLQNIQIVLKKKNKKTFIICDQ